MFSDRNRAKTIPFGVVCAHTCISLYKGGPAPLRAKKPLVIARLLNLAPPPPPPPPPPQKKKTTSTTTAANLLLVTTTYYFFP